MTDKYKHSQKKRKRMIHIDEQQNWQKSHQDFQYSDIFLVISCIICHLYWWQ
uniref:Uncharacterized protein n=1 Tax=Octopus bimaculoides TaxID=37653 RepID=A0A0L8HTV3_OCTBM